MRQTQSPVKDEIRGLRKAYDFLYLSESSSLQQVYRNLINAFNKFFNEGAGYPHFKSKKHHKQSFRIQNNNNIKIKDNTIVLPKIGAIYYRTSKEYKQLLNMLVQKMKKL